jgi:hypothetical protein
VFLAQFEDQLFGLLLAPLAGKSRRHDHPRAVVFGDGVVGLFVGFDLGAKHVELLPRCLGRCDGTGGGNGGKRQKALGCKRAKRHAILL